MAADFDNADSLKETYGVTKKHTCVYIKPDGEVIKKNSNKEHSMEDILAELDTIES